MPNNLNFPVAENFHRKVRPKRLRLYISPGIAAVGSQQLKEPRSGILYSMPIAGRQTRISRYEGFNSIHPCFRK